MSYQRFKKGGRVAKSQFLEKSVQKSLNKKIKTDFPRKSTFFQSLITHKRFIFEHSYILYGKRQKSCTFKRYLDHIIVSDVSDSQFVVEVDRLFFFFFCKRGST